MTTRVANPRTRNISDKSPRRIGSNTLRMAFLARALANRPVRPRLVNTRWLPVRISVPCKSTSPWSEGFAFKERKLGNHPRIRRSLGCGEFIKPKPGVVPQHFNGFGRGHGFAHSGQKSTSNFRFRGAQRVADCRLSQTKVARSLGKTAGTDQCYKCVKLPRIKGIFRLRNFIHHYFEIVSRHIRGERTSLGINLARCISRQSSLSCN